MSYITFRNVTKEYRSGENVVKAADNVSFGIEKGELCVVLGPSGAGKTTVLTSLAGWTEPHPGRLWSGAERSRASMRKS
jgi:putative ABC transport system ATP-binding protein